MKDMYSFDQDKESALETYEQVRQAYYRIFQTIGVPFLSVKQSEMSLTLSYFFFYFLTFYSALSRQRQTLEALEALDRTNSTLSLQVYIYLVDCSF